MQNRERRTDVFEFEQNKKNEIWKRSLVQTHFFFRDSLHSQARTQNRDKNGERTFEQNEANAVLPTQKLTKHAASMASKKPPTATQ
jgi:hypothetical protein